LTDPFKLEAKYYDKIWGLADRYKAEAKFLNQILKEHKAHRVLDLGCGTGGHCIELAKLGYDIVGLDISELMIEKASEKSSKEGVQISFILGDLTQTCTVLKNANIRLPFDAAISLGYSLAHMLNDQSFEEALDEIRKVLKRDGIFIFCVRNAEHLRDDWMRQIKMDALINEPNLQLALLCFNFRDNKNPDILIWNAIWLIKDQGKIDFQVRTHPLRWFRYDPLKRMLEAHGFVLLHTCGGTLGQEPFDSDKHDTILVICRRGE